MRTSNLTLNVTLRYIVRDDGQDLTHIDIRGDTIVGAGCTPTLAHIYTGKISYDFYCNKVLKVGDKIRYSDGPTAGVETIKYEIVEIQQLNAEGRPCCKLVRGKWVAMPTYTQAEIDTMAFTPGRKPQPAMDGTY